MNKNTAYELATEISLNMIIDMYVIRHIDPITQRHNYKVVDYSNLYKHLGIYIQIARFKNGVIQPNIVD